MCVNWEVPGGTELVRDSGNRWALNADSRCHSQFDAEIKWEQNQGFPSSVQNKGINNGQFFFAI